MSFPTASDGSRPTRRELTALRRARARRRLGAALASVTVAAMLALGMPTAAFAEETPPPTDPATTTEATTEATPTESTDSGESTTPGTETPDPTTDPAADPAQADPGTPAEGEPSEERPAEEPADDEASVDTAGQDASQQAARSVEPTEDAQVALVPTPGSGEAVITVRTGDTRSLGDPNSIAPLAGVQLGLYDAATGGTLLFTCTADAAGDCSFVVPNTGTGGANRDRAMWVRQISAPGTHFMNPFLRTGDAFGGDNQQTPYSFRVGKLDGGTWQVRAGQTYQTTPPATFMVGSGNTNRIASGGVWQSSRNNPVLPQQCGLDIAFVMDLSGSVNPSVGAARNAAKTLVDALVGTPSRIGLFTFAASAPANATNNQNRPITAVSTPAGATTVKTWIDGLTAPTNGTTNWDRGLYQVAQAATAYDVVIILTDGNPTVYGTETNPGDFTRVREVENAIFSANAVKSEGTRIVALGVGSGVSAPTTALNLRAISGGTAFNGANSAAADYYQTENYAAAGQAMRDLALGNCLGSVSVVKQVVPPSGDLALAQPAGGWAISAGNASGGISVGTPNPASGLTAAGTGSISYPLDFPGGATGTVTIRETNQAGFTPLPQAGVNAVCVDLNNGNAVIPGVTNAPVVAGQPGVIVPVTATTAASCTFYNQQPNPAATLIVKKYWAVNGQPPVLHGSQNPSLTGNASVNGVVTGFGDLTGGFTQGQTIPINENLGIMPTLCTLDSKKVTEFNDVPANFDLASGNFGALLVAGTNTVEITNVVTCPTKLTLRKDVDGDGVATDLWTLDALTPDGGVNFPAGNDGGSGVTGAVTPGLVYPLAESGGDPRYVQVDNRDPGLSVPGSTGSWACVPLDANGSPTGGNAGGLNGGVIVGFGNWVQCTAVNQTAKLTLQKQVLPLAGVTADPADWNLTATPQAPAVPGLDAQTVTTGSTISVRPGKGYNLSESTVPGFEQVSLKCNTGDGYVDATSVTLPANGVGTCIFVNRPIPPKLWLVKVVAPAGAASPSEWTVTATGDGGAIVAQGAGGTGGYVDVPAGQAFSLSESTQLPGAGDFTPSWNCSGGTLTGTTLSALQPGDSVICTVTNTLKPVTPTITKTAAVPTPNADGSWTITYDIVVTNPSPFVDLDYQLGDDLVFGSSVTVNSASYQRTLPAPPGAVTPFTAPIAGPQQFTGEPVLARGTSHTWRVTVKATVANGADFSGSSEAACDAGSPGTVGFLNTATMVVGGQVYGARDCELPVRPSVVKVAGTAVDNADGTWTLPYTITVTNPSADTGIIYDLHDQLTLPAGLAEVGVAQITAAPGGVTTEPGWTGHPPNTLVANDVSLAGTPGADQHVYAIAVVVRLTAASGSYQCTAQNGVANVATVMGGNQAVSDGACISLTPPNITHTKVVEPGSVVQAADGTWSIQYRIVVTNSSVAGGVYTLGDALRFGTGIDLGGASYAVTLDGSPLGTPWNGSGAFVTNRYLPGTSAGSGANIDTFLVTVTGIAVDGPTLTPAQTACPEDSSTGAFNNAADLFTAGAHAIKTACDFPTAPTIVKSGATAAQQADASWNVGYTLTVSNTAPGAKPSFHTLVDQPGFPAGVVFNSVSINGAAAVAYAGGAIPIAANLPIGAGATIVYTILLNVDVPSEAVPPGDRECIREEAGEGFFNTALLTSGEIVDDDSDCTNIIDGGKPTVDKSEGTATQDGDGLWTIEYDVTVQGNPDFVTKYTLTDTLRFGPEIDPQTAQWQQTEGGSDTGDWTDPAAQPTTTIVSTPRVIGIDEVHVYHVTVTALVSRDAFAFPTTNTCQPGEGAPNVGFLNEATLTSGTSQSDTGCALPAAPEIVKTADGPAERDGDGWRVSYTVTVHNTNPTQALVYDLEDTPDFAGSVEITDREVTSSDVTVNPAWNAVPPTTDVVVEDRELAGDATHEFTVTVWFTVDDVEGGASDRCSGEGGRGLLNGAVAVSGDRWTSEDCVDVPVIVILEKDWVIDGGDPIAWDSDELPDGFSAQALLDGDPVGWGEENGPYAIDDEVEVDETDIEIPTGCELVDWSGVGGQTLTETVNEFTVTNYVDCTQTVNLEKFVDNEHGGDAVPADWTLSGTSLADEDDTFSGDGAATGNVEVGVGYTLNEVSTVWVDGVAYEVETTWTCESEQGEDAFTLVSEEGSTTATLTVNQLGATVDCEIRNTDLPAQLTLTKFVEPAEVAAEFPPILWLLRADFDGLPDLSGNGSVTGTVSANRPLQLDESADFEWSNLFTAGPWICFLDEGPGVVQFDLGTDTVTLTPGQHVTCEITNTARAIDVSLVKDYELEEGETAVESGDEFDWVLTVENLGDDVDGLVVTDLIDSTLAVTGAATFDPAAGWTQTSGDTDNAFAAEFTGTYPAGAVTTIRIPVKVLPEPAIETPPAVDPNAPPPVLPPLDTDPIPNTACVAVDEPEPVPGEGDDLPTLVAAARALPPILDDRVLENNCDDAEVPVKRIQSGAYVRCIADVPWLYFDIQATDNVAPGPIKVTWTSADGTLTKVEEVQWDARNGRLLWPGAAVDEDGVPFQFPGWRPITEEDLLNPGSVVPGTRFLDLILDETVETFPWRGETYTPSGNPEDPWTVTSEPLTVTFSINPSQSVLAVYPQALPTCAIARPPLLDIVKTSSVTTANPGSNFSYTLSVTSTGIGAADPVELWDEIPADLRVNSITTPGAPTFPRWDACEVTGKDGNGYGGVLHCTLNGILGPNITRAPDVVLGVTLNPNTKSTSVTNTGEVCYVDADATDDPPQVLCADSSVKVNVPQPLAGTGFPGDWRWYAAILILLGGLVVGSTAIRRRRTGEVVQE